MVVHKNSYQQEIPDFIFEYLAQREKYKDYQRINRWIKENQENRKLLDQIIELWQVTLVPGRKDIYDENIAWKNFKNSLRVTEREMNKRYSIIGLKNLNRILSIAAILCIIFVSAFLLYKNSITKPNHIYSEFIVPYGSKSRINLPDSSVIWINAGSKLKYSNQFGAKNRNVFLSGEAYFEIKESKHPFVVITNKINIGVVSTKFNVKAYPEEKTVETTVLEGTVEIYNTLSSNTKTDKIILKSNQHVAFLFKTPNEDFVKDSITGKNEITESRKQFIDVKPNVTINKVDNPEIFSSWKDDRWLIKSEELQSLAKKLERKYDIKIVFKNESLKKYVFSGILKDETVEQVLEAIKLTAPIGFELENNVVSLYEISALKSKLQQAPK